jgi:hypothetical protein
MVAQNQIQHLEAGWKSVVGRFEMLSLATRKKYQVVEVEVCAALEAVSVVG